MQQHLGRQAGVSKVDVNLLDGKVAVLLKEDSRFDPAQILQSTFDSGVTVTEMVITARGTVEANPDGKLLFRVSPGQAFEVKPGDSAQQLQPFVGTEREITLRGRLYKKTDKK